MIEEREIEPEQQGDRLEHIPPISEIRDFELPADGALLDRVRRSIDRRETASGFIYLSTQGYFGLLVEFLSTLAGFFYSPPDQDGGEKES